jgi:hypothetical protein
MRWPGGAFQTGTFPHGNAGGVESTGGGRGGGNGQLMGNWRGATGDEFCYDARIMLKVAMFEAKGFLLRVDNISHFKSLMAGRTFRAVTFPVMKLR